MPKNSGLIRAGLLAGALVACSPERISAPKARPSTGAKFDVVGSSQLIFTELMGNPSRVDDGFGEWFELYNPGDTTVDLKGFSIAFGPVGGPPHIIARSVPVASHAFVVLGNNDDVCTNGGVIETYSYGSSIVLNNDYVSWLTLKAPNGSLVDSVANSTRAADGTIIDPRYQPHPDMARALKDVTLPHTILGPDDGSGNWADATTQYGLGDWGTPGVGPGQVLPPVGPVAGVSLRSPSNAVMIGATRKLSGCATDTRGALVLQTPVAWRSSDSTIATVDSTGLVTGVGQGVATISASAGGASATTTLSVMGAGAANSVRVFIVNPSQIPAGYSKPANAMTRDANGAIISPTPHLTWSTSDSTIATVDSLGYVTGVAPGVATVTAKSDLGATGTVQATIVPTTAPTTAVYRNNVEFGTPKAADPSNEFILTKPEYTVSYSKSRGAPNWVSWEMNASQFGTAARCGCYSPDPDLPPDFYKVVDADYRNSGYDHGALASPDSRTTTLQENATTYRLTNVLPQYPDAAKGPWASFFAAIDSLARSGSKEVYMIAGGIYDPAAPTLKNAGKVAIPSYTYAIAIVMDSGKGLADVHSTADLQVASITVPNGSVAGAPGSAVGIRGTPWQTYFTTVRSIETLTGYSFLNGLPPDIQVLVETGDRPPLSAAGGPYSGAEGSPVTFDGSGSSHPNNLPLTYLWSFGDSATSTGVAPTHTYADNGTYTVTLTVVDPYGVKASSTTSAIIANVAPTATFVVPATANEGTAFRLGLTNVVDPSTVDVAAGFQYSFDCGDGNGYRAFETWAWTRCMAPDNGVRAVAARVRDKDGGVTEYTGSLTIANLPPTATFVVPPSATAGIAFTLSLTNATDPSSVDVAAGLQFAFDCGDGSGYGAPGTQASATCPVVSPGTRTVRGRVSDKDGGVTEYTGTVPISGALSASQWPDEPPGLGLLAEYPFPDPIPATNGASLSGTWGVVFNPDGNVSRITDPAAPMGANVAQFHYPVGMADGSAPGTVFTTHTPSKEVFMGFWWKAGDPWENHPSNINKIVLWYPGANLGAIALTMEGPAPYTLIAHSEVPLDNRRLPGNVNATIITLGAWHKIEWYMKYNSTPVTNDGVLKWWLDGVLQGSYTDMTYPDVGFGEIHFSPTWGGVCVPQCFKTQESYYWYDYVHVTGR